MGMIKSMSDRQVYQIVIAYWFGELSPDMWWMKSAELDSTIEAKFSSIHKQARQGELYKWRNTPEGALAEVLILDQFSRNIFRDRPESFSCDAMALVLAQSAIEKGYDQELESQMRCFLYMPYMHSESTVIHEQAVKLFSTLDTRNNLDFELKHKAIIDRFGRYPHRNEILGRESTAEELAFLQQPNSSF